MNVSDSLFSCDNLYSFYSQNGNHKGIRVRFHSLSKLIIYKKDS